MPSIIIKDDVFRALDESIPRHFVGFPPCQVCKRRVKCPIAGTDGLNWYFGHARCVPHEYWMRGEDFNHLEVVLDWAYHLSEKSMLGRESWLHVVGYVRPQWATAAREVMNRFFADD